MRRAARLLQGSLKQLDRSWPEIETKLSFQHTPVRTQLQTPSQPRLVPKPAQFNPGSASEAGTSGLGRQGGLALLTKSLQQPPRSPGAVLGNAITTCLPRTALGATLPSTASSAGHAGYRGIARQAIFAAGVSAGAFVWAAHRDQQQRLHPKRVGKQLMLSVLGVLAPAGPWLQAATSQMPGCLSVQLPVHQLCLQLQVQLVLCPSAGMTVP